MSKLMQLPLLFGVRGSIATQTMANTTETQRQEINKIVQKIANNPAIAADKYEFIKQLANTIGGDYRSNRQSAEQEFYVAIWRATMQLLYHYDYSYVCTICNSRQYKTQNNKLKDFDRQYPICPSCNKSLLDNQIVSLVRRNKYYDLMSDKGILATAHKRIEIEKLVDTPIKPIRGDKKIKNEQQILNDPEQLGKWYSVWVWNYFRQILNENIIKTHNKKETTIAGPAHLMALQEIISELRKYNHKYYFDESTIYNNNFEILISVYATNILEFVPSIAAMINRYRNYDVEIIVLTHSIEIKSNGNTQIIDTTISMEDPVIMLSMNSPSLNSTSNTEEHSWSDIIEHNRIDKDATPNKLEDYIDEEFLTSIKNDLSDSNAKAIFDIYSQCGKIWQEFSDLYGNKVAAKSHISQYLNITVKEIENYREEIEHICQKHGLNDQR